MRGLFDGSLTLYVHADDARAISEAIHFKREMSISRMAIIGGYDSYLVADLLREKRRKRLTQQRAPDCQDLRRTM